MPEERGNAARAKEGGWVLELRVRTKRPTVSGFHRCGPSKNGGSLDIFDTTELWRNLNLKSI